MYNFQKYLEKEEKILYQGQPMKNAETKKNIGLISVILFMLFVQGLMIWSLVTKTGDGANGINRNFIIVFLVTLFFQGISICDLVYDFFIKKKAIMDHFFCITNKRVFKYEEKKNKLAFGYLENYEDMRVIKLKNRCGDLYMGIIPDDDDISSVKHLKELLFNPDSENMPFISFESIENPKEVLKIAKNARREILKMQEEKYHNE